MTAKKILFALIGLIATGLGIVGVWLPGLPTTIFVLIGLWAFSRSSERLYNWLSRIPLLKAALKEAKRYERERTVSRRVKYIAQLSAWTSFGLVAIVTRSLTVSLIVGACALACSAFMYFTPTSEGSRTPTREEEIL